MFVVIGMGIPVATRRCARGRVGNSLRFIVFMVGVVAVMVVVFVHAVILLDSPSLTTVTA